MARWRTADDDDDDDGGGGSRVGGSGGDARVERTRARRAEV
jgi:hypothetical protein